MRLDLLPEGFVIGTERDGWSVIGFCPLRGRDRERLKVNLG